MAIQLSVAVRNARLDQFEVITGTSAKLYIRSGAQPSDCSQADSGTLIATLSLPSDWMNDAGSGQKTINGGPWSGTASNPGTAQHFRIKDSTGTTCHMQGSVGQGTGDLQLDNTTITAGQTINITTFTLTDGNA